MLSAEAWRRTDPDPGIEVREILEFGQPVARLYGVVVAPEFGRKVRGKRVLECRTHHVTDGTQGTLLPEIEQPVEHRGERSRCAEGTQGLESRKGVRYQGAAILVPVFLGVFEVPILVVVCTQAQAEVFQYLVGGADGDAVGNAHLGFLPHVRGHEIADRQVGYRVGPGHGPLQIDLLVPFPSVGFLALEGIDTVHRYQQCRKGQGHPVRGVVLGLVDRQTGGEG